MSPRYSSPPFDQTTASHQGGCLSGFLIPPLAVICVGVLLAFLLLGSGPVNTLAAVPGTVAVNNTAQGMADQVAKPSSATQNQAGTISPVFPASVQYWSSAIYVWATAAGLDPNLAATVMLLESCGNPNARSRAGAMGLFQVMPYHFASGDDPYSPDTNAARGLAYLSRSLKTANGDARLALAGYNGGIGVIGRSESSWAGETQRYAYWGSGIYAEVSSGATESLRLQQWLNAGGASGCRLAASRLGIKP
jgi:soluble lytic murein transglycosylase-like protein